MGANFDPHLSGRGMISSKQSGIKGAIIISMRKIQNILPQFPSKRSLDTKPYSDEPQRSWLFRTVGTVMTDRYGNDIFAELRRLNMIM